MRKQDGASVEFLIHSGPQGHALVDSLRRKGLEVKAPPETNSGTHAANFVVVRVPERLAYKIADRIDAHPGVDGSANVYRIGRSSGG